MFRSLFWYTKAAVSLFSSRKPLKKAEQFLLTDNRTEGDTFSTSYVKQWAKDRVADSGSTINIKGLENIPDQNGILFMSNHQSNFDILLLLAEYGLCISICFLTCHTVFALYISVYRTGCNMIPAI